MLIGVLDHHLRHRHDHERWGPGLLHLCKVHPPVKQLVAHLRHPRVVALTRPAGNTYTILGVDNLAPVATMDNTPPWFRQGLPGRSFNLEESDGPRHPLAELIVFGVARVAPPTIMDERTEPTATRIS